MYRLVIVVFFQAEDGIRYLVRSRGLGDVYKRQAPDNGHAHTTEGRFDEIAHRACFACRQHVITGLQRLQHHPCLLYTSDAADERSSVDLGGRRIIKKKKREELRRRVCSEHTN